MATEQIYKSTSAKNVDIDLLAGEITVEATNEVEFVEVVVRTGDDEGQSADIVNDAKFREYQNGVLGVRLKTPSGTAASSVIFRNNGGVIISNTSGGVSIVGGRVYVDGREVTAADNGGAVIGRGPSKVQVIVRMPQYKTLTVDTTSAITLAEGRFDRVSVGTLSGSLEVEDTKVLTWSTTSGSVKAHKVTNSVIARSVSGSIKIREWSGGDLKADSVSGSVKVGNAKDATGHIVISTVSGSIQLESVNHLRVKTSTVSGRIRRS